MHKMMAWLSDSPYRMFTAIGSVIVIAFGGLTYLSIQEQKQWDAFAADHQCKQIAHIDGYNAYGYYNGKYTTYWVPSKNTYHCNDGIDYTR